MDNIICSAVGFVHFYFGAAGTLWWLVLCFAWFLVTTLKWGEAPVGQVFGSYFNLIAWGTPGVAAVLILIINVIDGDLFTGICTVGNLRPEFLMHYVAVPQATFIGNSTSKDTDITNNFSDRVFPVCLWIHIHLADSFIHQRTETGLKQIRSSLRKTFETDVENLSLRCALSHGECCAHAVHLLSGTSTF